MRLLIDNIRSEKSSPQTAGRPIFALNVLVAHARRLSPNISMQHVKRLSRVLARAAQHRYLPRSASTLLLSSSFFPPPFLFLDKKRRSLPAYLEAMRYTDAGGAPERNDVLIRTPIAERKRREGVKYIKIHSILR